MLFLDTEKDKQKNASKAAAANGMTDGGTGPAKTNGVVCTECNTCWVACKRG